MPSDTHAPVVADPLLPYSVKTGPVGLPTWISMIWALGAFQVSVTVPTVAPPVTGMGFGTAVREAPFLQICMPTPEPDPVPAAETATNTSLFTSSAASECVD